MLAMLRVGGLCSAFLLGTQSALGGPERTLAQVLRDCGHTEDVQETHSNQKLAIRGSRVQAFRT